MSSRSGGRDRVRRRYECGRCGGVQPVTVHPADTDRTIGYSCDECRDVTPHEPTR